MVATWQTGVTGWTGLTGKAGSRPCAIESITMGETIVDKELGSGNAGVVGSGCDTVRCSGMGSGQVFLTGVLMGANADLMYAWVGAGWVCLCSSWTMDALLQSPFCFDAISLGSCCSVHSTILALWPYHDPVTHGCFVWMHASILSPWLRDLVTPGS